jgi:hypothetical protein
MSEAVFLINPKGRRRRKNPMPAGLRRYWAARRGHKRRKVRMSNPKRHRRRSYARRRNPVAVAPRRRRNRWRFGSRARRSRRRRNPIFRMSRRRRRRNPFGSGEIKSVIMPALVGAIGATAVAVGYGYLGSANVLPASLSTGVAATLVQAVFAVGVGFLVGKFMGRNTGNGVAIGALTVIAANQLSSLVSSTAPNVPGVSGLGALKLGGVGDYVPYRRKIGAYMNNPRLPGRAMNGLGFVSPAPGLRGLRGRGVGAYMNTPVPGMGSMHADYSGGSGWTGLPDGM